MGVHMVVADEKVMAHKKECGIGSLGYGCGIHFCSVGACHGEACIGKVCRTGYRPSCDSCLSRSWWEALHVSACSIIPCPGCQNGTVFHVSACFFFFLL